MGILPLMLGWGWWGEVYFTKEGSNTLEVTSYINIQIPCFGDTVEYQNLGLERGQEKSRILLWQKSGNPGLCLQSICNGQLSKVNNGCILNSQHIVEHIFYDEKYFLFNVVL